MKYGTKTRTLRGTISAVAGKAEKNLIVDDLRINEGLVIEEFVIWPQRGFSTVPRTCNAILSYSALGDAAELMDAGDNTQFGWAAFDYSQIAPAPPGIGGNNYNQFNYIDPNHIVNRDMFLSLRLSTSGIPFNYLIICRQVELSDNEAIITIIKENSQS